MTPVDAVVGRLGGRHEPDDLAVVLDVGAPGVGAAGDDRQAAAEGDEQVVVLVLEVARPAAAGARARRR